MLHVYIYYLLLLDILSQISTKMIVKQIQFTYSNTVDSHCHKFVDLFDINSLWHKSNICSC